MAHVEELVDQYCEGWSAPSPQERERLLRGALTDDAIYCDPRANRLNVSQLLEHISRVHATRPGANVVRTSNIDVHHDFARFHWHVAMPDGNRLPEGIDIIELTEDGKKIQKILGFFGPLNPLRDNSD